MAFASKTLGRAETQYSNIKGLLQSLQKFHHYCFAHDNMVTDYKPLVAIFNKKCGILVTKIMMDPTVHTQEQDKNSIQARPKTTYHHLAIQGQL